MIRLRSALFCIAVLLASPVSFAQTCNVKVNWRSEPVGNRVRNVVVVFFIDSEENYLLPADKKGLLYNEGAADDPSSYRLEGTLGEAKWQVPVTMVPLGFKDNLAGSVQLVPKTPPRKDATYSLTIKPNCLIVRMDGKDVPFVPDHRYELDSDELELEKEFTKPKTLDDWLDFGGGGDGGTVSARLRYDLNRDKYGKGLQFQVRGSADLSFDHDDEGEYFNNLTGEIRGYRSGRTNIFGLLKINERYVEYGLHYRIESDQGLDNADHNLGLQFAMYTKDPISEYLANLFMPEKNCAIVSPLLIAEYNYVKQVTEDAEPGDPLKPDTSDGDHRLGARLHWVLPIARDLKLTLFPSLPQFSDVELLVEAGGVYDFDESEFYDKSRIALQFSTATDGETNTAFEFVWARGESAPIFDQINTFLVGIKLSR